MNPEAEEKLNSVVKKEVAWLTKEDKMFLKARRSYLSEEQLEKFGSVFKVPKTNKK